MSKLLRRFSARWLNAVAYVVVLGLLGCGQSMSTVKGKVSFDDGSPLTEGTVLFESDKGAEKPVSARGIIQPDGSFVMSTINLGDGVPPGHYKVMVLALPKIDPNLKGKPKVAPPFDPRFSDFGTSKLDFEVKSGSNDYPITLSKKKK
jgi:hypothetical protein